MKTLNDKTGLIASINKSARAIIDRYYRLHEADDFFRIDQMLRECRRSEVTVEEVPTLIEMQNIIVMG